VYGERGIPLVLPACTANSIAAGARVVRLCPSDRLQMAAVAQAVDEGGARACFVHAEPAAYAERLWRDLDHSLLARGIAGDRLATDSEAALPAEPGGIHVLLGHAPWIAAWLDRHAAQLGGQRVIACDEGSAVIVLEQARRLVRTVMRFLAPSIRYPELLAQAVDQLASQRHGPSLDERLRRLEALGHGNAWRLYSPSCP
jgi:ABC-type branched-subunit amino acid transport system substrate-binding protein